MPPRFTAPRSFMRYELAIGLAVLGTVLAVGSVCIALVIAGLNERTMPILLSAMASLGVALTALTGALKSTESADTASKAKNVSELTASQIAALQQIASSCTSETCPFKRANDG